MPTPFQIARAAAMSVVDGMFAEAFTLSPKAMRNPADVNGRRVSDASRLDVEFAGIFVAEGKQMRGEGRGNADSDALALIGDGPFVAVARTAFEDRPRREDVVRRAETGAEFRITDVIEARSGRYYLKLVRTT